MRLNAFLAKAGISSRRGADELIKTGRVSVNGRIGLLNDYVDDSDIVKVNKKQIEMRKSRYILLYKPAGYITTLKDEKGRRKVTDLVKIPERVVPVGRLDFNTTGALLLTNDGELAHRLMHPSYEADKIYQARVDGNITPEILRRLREGIIIGNRKTAPAKAKRLAGDTVGLIIHEGRKHQVKKMLAAVDLPVKSLHRPIYAGLELTGLKPGQWRDLTASEIKKLKG
jgi:pseudouridine synthase